MRFIGHRIAFLVAVALIAFVGRGDDTAGIMRIDAGANEVVEAEMPFSFYLHGRIPYPLSQLEHPNTQTLKPYPIFSGISVDSGEGKAPIHQFLIGGHL